MAKYSKADVFHGTDLSEVVTQVQEGCPPGYEVIDLDVKFLNNLWVVISKIDSAWQKHNLHDQPLHYQRTNQVWSVLRLTAEKWLFSEPTNLKKGTSPAGKLTDVP